MRKNKHVKLKEIATITAGYPFRGKIEPFEEGEIQVIRSQDMPFDGAIAAEKLVRVALPPGNKSLFEKRHKLKTGDVLLLARGTPRAAYLVDLPDRPLVAAPQLFRIQPDTQLILPAYLSWQLNSERCMHHLLSQAEGSTQKSIRRPQLEALEIALPSLKIQQYILDLNEAIREEQALYQELIDNRDAALNTALAELLG